MKILLAGLRGVGKSAVGQLVAKDTGFPIHSLSDLLRKEFPDFMGSSSELRDMLEALSIQERAATYKRVICTLNTYERFILEMPIVECGDFGLMVPREPILRLVSFDVFALLEAEPAAIIKRRHVRPPKGQNPFYLEESAESIKIHQEIARQMLIGLGAVLARPVFIIRNRDDPAATARAIVATIPIAKYDAVFYLNISSKS